MRGVRTHLSCRERMENTVVVSTPGAQIRFRGAHAPRVCRSAPPPTVSRSNQS